MFRLGVLDLLALAGFDREAPAKMARHKDKRYDVDELLQNGWFELYQAYQSRPLFDRVEYVVSFSGLAGTLARFEGVWCVRDVRPAAEGEVPPGCKLAPELKRTTMAAKGGGRFYRLERVPDFEDLEQRIVIDWGSGALTWAQHSTNKPVVELLPKGRSLPPFNDYVEFTLTYAELQKLFQHPDAHREWQARLEAVGGVYLILASGDGHQYVGSASGSSGIWGRWQNYAVNGHGGNILLKELIAKQPDQYPKGFRFSILRIVSKTMSRDEVVRCENKFKEKLGSRAYGLNLDGGAHKRIGP